MASELTPEEEIVPEFWITVCLFTVGNPERKVKRAAIILGSIDISRLEWFTDDGEWFDNYADMKWADILDDGIYRLNILPVWSGRADPDCEWPSDYKVTSAELLVRLPKLE